MQHMLFRVLALAGLAVLVAAMMLVAAAGLRSWLLAAAALLPVALVVAAPGTAFGLFALVATVPLALVPAVRARC
jgi:hypothetical protein